MTTLLTRPTSLRRRRYRGRRGPAIKPKQNVSNEVARRIETEVVAPLFTRIKRQIEAARASPGGFEDAIRYLGTLPLEDRQRILSFFGDTVFKLAHHHRREFGMKMFHFLGVDITYALNDDAMRPIIMQRIDDGVQYITSMPQKQVDRLSKKIQDLAVDPQRSFSRAAVLDLVNEQASYAQSHARLIARDQVSKATGAFNEARQVQAGFQRYVWSTSNDNRVRYTHQVNEGITFDWHTAPTTGHPGEDVQCFRSSTLVNPAGLQAFVSYRYVGYLVKIRLAQGVELAITPNHPVLTNVGWKRADDVNVGDKLFKHAGSRSFATARPNPQVANMDTSAEQLQRFLNGSGTEGITTSRSVDLHGEPATRNENVNVVNVPSVLRANFDALSDQIFGNFPFKLSYAQLFYLRHLCHVALNRREPARTSDFFIGGEGESLAFLKGGVFHSDCLGFGLRPNGQFQVDQTLANEVAGALNVFRYLFDGNFAFIHLADGVVVLPPAFKIQSVTGISKVWHDDLIYSGQTKTGYIILNGILTHNCRCVALADINSWTRPPQAISV